MGNTPRLELRDRIDDFLCENPTLRSLGLAQNFGSSMGKWSSILG